MFESIALILLALLILVGYHATCQVVVEDNCKIKSYSLNHFLSVRTRLIVLPIRPHTAIFIFNERDSKTITLISQISHIVNDARSN